jgi:hypothetical protein
MKARALLFVLLLTLVAAGCGSDTQEAPTTPTTPTSPATVTWWGILPVPGSVSRSFVATQAGAVTATLTTISATTEPMMLGIGIPQNGESGCVLTQSTQAVSRTDPLLSLNVDAGTFCLKLFSTGQTPASVTFEVKLVHP